MSWIPWEAFGAVWAVSNPCLLPAATASVQKGAVGRSWKQQGMCTAMLLYWRRADTTSPPSSGDNSCEHMARRMGQVWQDHSYLKLEYGHSQSTSNTPAAGSSSRLQMPRGSGVRSSCSGSGNVVVSSGNTFWDLLYLRICFLLLRMKSVIKLLWGEFTTANAGMIHDPLGMCQVFEKVKQASAKSPCLAICCHIGILWYLPLWLFCWWQHKIGEILPEKEKNLFSRVMSATGEKGSLYFSLVPVPLTELLLEETLELKTTHRHRKTAEAWQSHMQDETDAAHYHPLLLHLITACWQICSLATGQKWVLKDGWKRQRCSCLHINYCRGFCVQTALGGNCRDMALSLWNLFMSLKTHNRGRMLHGSILKSQSTV